MSALTVGVRHWDHVIPLALGDVTLGRELAIDRRESTPNLWTDDGLQVSETSFSSYVRARARGDDRVTALPVFVMRGFRHRCIIVAKTSAATTAADLAGARIGLTGWPDSGNTWTRAILRADGVDIADAEWIVGRLTDGHPIEDRLGGVAVPENVTAIDHESMVSMLERGVLDAVMTPFMPPGFFAPDSPFRSLYPDTRDVERRYFEAVGFIPGIHVLGVRSEVLDAELAQELVDGFAASQSLAHARRARLLDVTPWQNEAFAVSAAVFGDDFNPIGWSANAPMVSAFQDELVAQGLMAARLPLDELFPHPLEPSLAGAVPTIAGGAR